jgi:hypothetical protein
MTIQQLITVLQQMLETGGFEPEDELVVTWWSHEDVALLSDEDQDMSAEKARDIWAEVVTRFDHNIDSVIERGNDILFDYLKEVAE